MSDEKNRAALREESQLNLPLLQQALQQVKALKAQLEAEQAGNKHRLQQAMQQIEALESELKPLKKEIASLKRQPENNATETIAEATSAYAPRQPEPVRLTPVLQNRSAVILENGQPANKLPDPVSQTNTTLFPSTSMTPEEKIALFRALFVGRQHAYAVRWESESTGKSGYEPARSHNYASHVYDKTRKKKVCKTCPDLKLTDEALKHHLQGKHTLGIYPLVKDDTCSFLVIDLDEKDRKNITQRKGSQLPWLGDKQIEKTDETTGLDQNKLRVPISDVPSWKDDATAVINAARSLKIPAYLERSRSGKGGHVWIFFEGPVSGAKARRLGEALMTKTNQDQDQLSIRSYDRMFPNQDTLPQLGYGNLIALPLQKRPLAEGNSAFVDETMTPYPDQWTFLKSVQKMLPSTLEAIVSQAMRQKALLPVPRPYESDGDDKEDPWALPPSGKSKKDTILQSPRPEHVMITLCNLAYVSKEGMTRSHLNRIERIAAFQNPEFYKNQALRKSNYKTPRIISCAEEFADHLGLPRGCLQDLTDLLETSGVQFKIDDKRFAGKKIRAKFNGKLRPEQTKAVKELLIHDTGVLSATTAFGKTVLAAYCISKRKVNTLVLVHRQQLLRQWKQKLESFLDLPPDSIGQIGAGKNKPTGIVDVATIQSLWTENGVKDLVADYGQIIVDECHVIGAARFEQILRQVKAKFVLGLTATPVRADGHHPIVVMQCGPIRYRARNNESGIKEYLVFPKTTNTELPSYAEDFETQEILSFLIHQESRNKLIIDDVVKAVYEKKTPLVLTKRKEHLPVLAELLKDKVKNVLVYKGGLGKKQQRQFAEKLASIPSDEERVILATGQSIGEGFDDARLDTLFLAMPISWSGTLTQYAGRLHRSNDGKSVVQIYDYIDVEIDKLYRMFQKRQAGYKKIGYKMQPLMPNNS